ncbi:MAG: hypothetical protein HY709_11975 [Candidatus Latescibacteria bacterium]|nr:hypothetical protein [Candidatus Latescibacterota bacterium]
MKRPMLFPNPLRLHLGCGPNYLEGYVNIDVDDAGGTRKVDYTSPVEGLIFPPNTVDEIRIEHVFEHFPRWMGELLLLEWFTWLKPGGLLVMAVPDFESMARAILELEDEEEKCFKYRHIFGTHYNLFSFHLDGFTRGKLKWMLERHGYTIIHLETVDVAVGTTRARKDIHLVAAKNNSAPSQEERIAKMINVLKRYEEFEETIPFVTEYLKKILGQTQITTNFWLDRYPSLRESP